MTRSFRRGIRTPIAALGVAALGLVLLALPASAQVASSLLNENDPLPAAGPGHIVSSLGNTAVNHVGGRALGLSSSDGTTTLSHVWGSPLGLPDDILRTEGTFGSLVQTSYESFYGMDDLGSVAYSASGTGGPVGGFDSVWKDDTPIMVEGDPYPHAANTWWRFGSRPGITADGQPYFVGGLTDTQGGSTQNYGLFYGLAANPIYLGGDNVPGLPFILDTASTVSFDYRFSALGSQHIAELKMVTGSTADDNVMVLSGSGLTAGGGLVREGDPVPAGIGGLPGENWDNFDNAGVTEAGEWFFTGDTDGATATDEIVVKNGVVLYREGDTLDGKLLTGSIEGAYMNENGDLAFQWDVDDAGTAFEALFLNDQLVLKEGDAVDFDGDGLIDPNAILVDFTGIASLTLTDRDFSGMVSLYFTADIDTAGTSSTTDDVEGFYCLPVSLGAVPVVLSGLSAEILEGGQGVSLTWTTTFETEHAGFHVYRASAVAGPYVRLTDELVVGRGEYEWIDRTVRGGETYYYRVGAVDLAGGEVLSNPVVISVPQRVRVAELLPSFPNPFVRQTSIRFTLPRETEAELSVFDVAGRRVATLVDGVLPAGEHTATWDGVTLAGRPGAGGVYFYRLETDGVVQTRKMVRLGRE